LEVLLLKDEIGDIAESASLTEILAKLQVGDNLLLAVNESGTERFYAACIAEKATGARCLVYETNSAVLTASLEALPFEPGAIQVIRDSKQDGGSLELSPALLAQMKVDIYLSTSYSWSGESMRGFELMQVVDFDATTGMHTLINDCSCALEVDLSDGSSWMVQAGWEDLRDEVLKPPPSTPQPSPPQPSGPPPSEDSDEAGQIRQRGFSVFDSRLEESLQALAHA